MSFFYLDSSALVKRYLPEVGSTWINTLTDSNSGHTILVSALTRVEAAAAIAARQRAGTITIQERDTAVALLLQHYQTEYRSGKRKLLFTPSSLRRSTRGLADAQVSGGWDN